MPNILSVFNHQLVTTAEDQYSKYHFYSEADSELCTQIKKYWDDLNIPFKSCTTVPWSAVFVSWCVKQAGASSSEFKFADAHSIFVKEAIKNAINNSGVFRGYDIKDYKPKIGDIIQNNRGNNKYDYEFAKNHDDYESHSAIVIEIGQDKTGTYALTVGGNEGNSIHQTINLLTVDGFIQQRGINPYICVISNLK